MRLSFRVLVSLSLVFSSTAWAKTDAADVDLGKQSYMSLVEGLKTKASKEEMAQFDQAYRDLVGQGAANPTIAQVTERGMSTAEIGTACALIGGLSLYFLGRWWEMRQQEAKRNEKCKDRAAQILKEISPHQPKTPAVHSQEQNTVEPSTSPASA